MRGDNFMKSSKAQAKARVKWSKNHKYESRKSNYRSNAKLYLRQYATINDLLRIQTYLQEQLKRKLNNIK